MLADYLENAIQEGAVLNSTNRIWFCIACFVVDNEPKLRELAPCAKISRARNF